MEKEETIDLQVIFNIGIKYKRMIAGIILLCLSVSVLLAFFILPPTYESTVLVRAKAQGKDRLSAAAGAMAMLGISGGAAAPVMVYTELMKSRAVIRPVIEGLERPEAEKEKMSVEGFAKENLKIANTKGTDLIAITAVGRTPEEAQQVAKGVYTGFKDLMTRMNQDDQSQMISFLKERIAVAKEEMEASAKELREYQQQEKVYVPDEQAKALIEQAMFYDKAAGEVQVGLETAKAKLGEVSGQLARQNAALQEYHIADNPGIQKIRDSLLEKKLSLVKLEQKYTEKHPDVINMKEQVAALQAQLNKEVEDSIEAGTNTLNPIHAGLLKEKVLAETEILTRQKEAEKIEFLKKTSEQEISRLSAAGFSYVALERKAKMTAEIYVLLVKNYEEAKIQNAMESMELQLVDNADLPKKPAGPRKFLIMALGLMSGIILTMSYVLFLYSRQARRQNNLGGTSK